MMKRFLISAVLILALITSGCGGGPQPVAGLTPQPVDQLKAWGIPDRLSVSGEGNVFRPVSGVATGGRGALELAAGGHGSLSYHAEMRADADPDTDCRLQFLSTQGTGRIRLSALDQSGKVLASVGWVYTGAIPAGDGTKWKDVRYTANYVGEWIALNERPSQLLSAELGGVRAAAYRIAIEVGEGQHALITACSLPKRINRLVRVVPENAALSAKIGENVAVVAEVENASGELMENVRIDLVEPAGYGVTTERRSQSLERLQPGEKKRLTWQVKAQRADAVNFGKPWEIGFAMNDLPLSGKVAVSVADPRPGRIFYVMTEDLEGIDSAGYATAWGNGDGWLQPEELDVQMIRKVEAIDRIAEKYGAKWTHYIAWPLVRAAEWATPQSSSGAWKKFTQDIRQSVRQETAKGHEYGIHLHSDYDPLLPGNVLSYNAASDGIWANHLRHGWAHSLGAEGTLRDHTSRAGFLFSYQRTLDELASGSKQGQLLTARVGSFDFGNGEASEAMSTRVYKLIGLWGSSDADGNKGGITSGDYGREIYFARPDDINLPAQEINKTGIVEFRPTPVAFINYDAQSADTMNVKVDQGITAFTSGGRVLPGVHAIVGFTHVMFIMGDGGWKSLEGGAFGTLDRHLGYLKESYVSKGQMEFGTASELTAAYIDYYTPELVALYGPKTADTWSYTEYSIRLLGKDIAIDAAHPHQVAVKYPSYLRDSSYRVTVLKNGTPIAGGWGLAAASNEIPFTVDDKTAAYTLRVYHADMLADSMELLRNLKARMRAI